MAKLLTKLYIYIYQAKNSTKKNAYGKIKGSFQMI